MAEKLLVTSADSLREVGRIVVTGESGPAEAHLGRMPQGYPSIASMLAASPFYVAHRGGSADWDEMTLRAYTSAVAWGAGALEVSLARTLDGVYFGLHDEYLDRVALGTDTQTLDPRVMTWAEVQQYQVFGREPFMRLEEVTEAYGGSHVLFLDPKFINRSNATSRNHFLDTVKTLVPDWPTRVVIKLFWGFNSDWGAAAKSAGFTTWGYLWHDDGFTQITTTPSARSNFDLLGFNYDASSGNWSTVVALGKPVIGHVCPDAAAASAALSKGAVGVMAAGVKSIIPPALPWA